MKTILLVAAAAVIIYGLENPEFYGKVSQKYFAAKAELKADWPVRHAGTSLLYAEPGDPLLDAVLKVLDEQDKLSAQDVERYDYGQTPTPRIRIITSRD